MAAREAETAGTTAISAGRSVRPREAARRALTETLAYLRSQEVGHSEEAEAAARRLTTRPEPLLLVLGEPGRGKTSLVRLLAPHETSAQHEAWLEERYRRVVPPNRAKHPGVSWLSRAGTRQTEPDEEVVGAEVAWASCRLGEDVVIVDTPCVDGIGGAQAVVNRSLVARATTAVFVTDAGAPLSLPEVDYIMELLAPLDSLVVVVTKTDTYEHSWREVVATNKQLLAARRDERVAVVGVSTVMGELATRQEDPHKAAILAEKAGVDFLVSVLRGELARAELVPYTAALRMARTALGSHQRSLQDRLEVARSSGADLDALIAERRDRVAELRDQQDSWLEYFNRDFASLRSQIVRDSHRRIDEWRSHWRTRIETDPTIGRRPETAEAVEGELLAALASLRKEVLDQAERHLAELVVRFFGAIEVPGADGAGTASELAKVFSSSDHPEPSRHIYRPTASGLDLNASLQGWIGMNMTSGLLSMSGVAAALGTGLGAVVGQGLPVLGGLGLMLYGRKTRQVTLNRSVLANEVQRLAADEKSDIIRTYDDVWNRVRPDIVLAYKKRLRDEIAAAELRVKEAGEQRRRSQTEASLLASQVTAELDEAAAHVRVVTEALDRLRAARVDAPATG